MPATVPAKSAILAALIAVAGCGTATPTRPPAPHALPVKVLTAAQEREECGALDLIRLGYETYPRQVQVLAGEYAVSQAEAERMIARIIRDACPAEVSVIPPGDPLP